MKNYKYSFGSDIVFTSLFTTSRDDSVTSITDSFSKYLNNAIMVLFNVRLLMELV